MATKINQLNLSNIQESKLPLVIGYFGCVHIMHSQLFEKYYRYNVLTFKDFKNKSKEQLYTYKERLSNISEFKPKNIFVYDLEKHNMTAKDFINKVLIPLKPSIIVVGKDFKFGSDNKQWNVLEQFFQVQTINYNKNISTSKISNLLLKGDIEKANGLLYKPYYYISNWISGNKLGRKMGYPTINLNVNHKLSLKEGSYVSKITIGFKTYKSISFVGKSKTFKSNSITLETHALDKLILPRSLYPNPIKQNIKVEFFQFIRSNTKFKNQNLLKKAIERDISRAKTYFAKNK